jgi:hypothetical protein
MVLSYFVRLQHHAPVGTIRLYNVTKLLVWVYRIIRVFNQSFLISERITQIWFVLSFCQTSCKDFKRK